MNFFKYSILLTCLIAAASKGTCQETPAAITLANEAYERHEYVRAAKLYEKVATFRKVPIDVPNKLANCYREVNDYANAEKWYKKITEKNPSDAADWVNYADALKSQGKYMEAKAAYKNVPDSLYSRIFYRVAGCDSAIAWITGPTQYTVSNFSAINTRNSDWGAVWYGAHSVVFTSDSLRPSTLDKESRINAEQYRRTDRPFQKIYVMDSTNRGLGFIRGFAPVMNYNIFHDGPVSFNRKGDTAYFTVTNPSNLKDPGEKIKYKEGKKTVVMGVRRLELYWTVKDSTGKWGTIRPFAYNNATKYSVGHAAISNDGRVIYFTSDMPGGYGKTDIWYVEKQADNTWSVPINCGPQINTEEDEAFPTIGLDGTLYFASKGHIGMGGFDIFKAFGQRGRWRDVTNLQFPVNSPGDDFYYTTKDSVSGFLSSDRPGGKGSDDIYVYIINPFVPGAPGFIQVIMLKTQVFDRLSREPLGGARVVIINNQRGLRWTSFTNEDGLTYKVLDPEAHIIDSAFKPGYSSAGDTISTVGIHHSDTLSIRLYLEKSPQPGDVFILRNLYYNFDKSNIRPDAAVELNRLLAYMGKYPTMVIDLTSHTDSRGSDSYNMALSERRALSARTYLMAHGIAGGRIMARGYGETRLTNRCRNGVRCSSAEHQANRRTEIKILRP